MGFLDFIIGNSSSGLLEAPSFKIGTINIGDRQKGRIKAKSVIDCLPEKKKYKKKYKKGLLKRIPRNIEKCQKSLWWWMCK